MAAAIVAVSALSGALPSAARDPATPPNGVPISGGWTARFFVSPVTRDSGLPDDAIIRRNATLGVNAQFSRPIAKDTRLSIDVTNLFDRDAAATQGLVPPADGRGLRIQLRRTF
jgi:outer membrane receptor protein involved in Fe transport